VCGDGKVLFCCCHVPRLLDM